MCYSKEVCRSFAVQDNNKKKQPSSISREHVFPSCVEIEQASCSWLILEFVIIEASLFEHKDRVCISGVLNLTQSCEYAAIVPILAHE